MIMHIKTCLWSNNTHSIIHLCAYITIHTPLRSMFCFWHSSRLIISITLYYYYHYYVSKAPADHIMRLSYFHRFVYRTKQMLERQYDKDCSYHKCFWSISGSVTDHRLPIILWESWEQTKESDKSIHIRFGFLSFFPAEAKLSDYEASKQPFRRRIFFPLLCCLKPVFDSKPLYFNNPIAEFLRNAVNVSRPVKRMLFHSWI